MTLNAQTLVTGTAQVEFKQRSVTGIVTGVTGHRLTVARVIGRITGRVTEVIVILVTGEAALIPRPLEHCRCWRTVQLMAVETAFSMGVKVEVFLPPFKFTGMTVAADLPGVPPNQSGLLTGMWGMTIETEGAASAWGHMVKLLIKALHHVSVTA